MKRSQLTTKIFCAVVSVLAAFSLLAADAVPAFAQKPAKQLFGKMPLPANIKPASHGFYSKGCLAGGVAIPVDGPTWQVMRLSRNRRWGHPAMIALIEQLSIKSRQDGWNGLLVGDISQPRGGPMLTGHASHQIGLDADLWLTPMPDKRMSYKEREETSAISILANNGKGPYVNDRRWNKSYERLLYHAASFPQVERLLVHPGIKKKLCDTVKGDRSWLNKVRPYWGHHYHFHVRIGCQPGSPGCKPQKGTGSGTGCDSSLQWWFDVGLKPKKPSKSTKPSKPKPPITLADLPAACQQVLAAPAKSSERAEFQAASLNGFAAPEIDLPKRLDPLAALASAPIEAGGKPVTASVSASVPVAQADSPVPISRIPVPTPRPSQ